MEQNLVKRDPFELMDRLDDEQIIAEIEGKVPKTWVYHFEDKGQVVWGLSKRGVDECKRYMAKKGEAIREIEAAITENPDNYYAQGKAGRYVISGQGTEVLLDTKIGFKRQSKAYDSKKINPFAYEQAGVKALRNACADLIPETIKQAVIEKAKKTGKVQNIADREKPPPESASKLRSRGKSKGKDAPKGVPDWHTTFQSEMKILRGQLGTSVYYSILKEYGYDTTIAIKDKSEAEKLMTRMVKERDKSGDSKDQPGPDPRA